VLAQRCTLQELHDGVGDRPLGAEVMDGEDVGVVETGHRFGLALEAGEPVRIGSHVFRQDLDRDVPFEAVVPGAIHNPHSPRAEGFQDLVTSETGAGVEHVCLVSHCDIVDEDPFVE
jgi:hypothetical protein